MPLPGYPTTSSTESTGASKPASTSASTSATATATAAPRLNRFQRAYFAWAQPHYARMAPELRAEVERMDRWLYSRRGAGVWVGGLAAVAASTAGLVVNGLPLLLALASSAMVWLCLPLAMLAAWLQPQKFMARKLMRNIGLAMLGGYVGALLGFLTGRVAKYGGLKLDTLGEALWSAARQATPLLGVAVFVILGMVWGISLVRRRALQSQLERLRLVQERDLAARQAAEARLRVLQAQIQPHFVFNTLAAMQHWVDTGDARAGPLLRSLTQFLRGATEAMLAPQATLAHEADMAGHYLAIMQSRLGERLRVRIDVAPDCTDQLLPSGLLMTLVENAVQHGIEPQVHGGELALLARRMHDGFEQGVFELRVLDDGAGLRPGWADGVGLANSRARLQHQFGGRATLALAARPGAAGTEVVLRIHPGSEPAAPGPGPMTT